METNICPRCEINSTEHGAISRADNLTDICSDCGVAEARLWFVLADAGYSMYQIKTAMAVKLQPDNADIKEIIVEKYPVCEHDYCGREAHYYAMLENPRYGLGSSWSYLCDDCFATQTKGLLGTEHGQKLTLDKNNQVE